MPRRVASQTMNTEEEDESEDEAGLHASLSIPVILSAEPISKPQETTQGVSKIPEERASLPGSHGVLQLPLHLLVKRPPWETARAKKPGWSGNP